MTASISFEVESKQNVLKIPNAALWFYPNVVDQVRPEDRPLLDGSKWSNPDASDQEQAEQTAVEKISSRREQEKRHVWVQDGPWLRAVEIYTGLADNQFTELLEGDLVEGVSLVVGEKK
jgi:HlyD family secretion protein